MTTPLLSPPPIVAICDDGGHPLAQPAGWEDGRDLMPSVHGRAAELVAARHYLGFDRDDGATVYGVRPGTYQRWENGRDPIPEGILDDRIPALLTGYDKAVTDLLAAVPADAKTHRVKVWRGPNHGAGRPFPGWWMRVVVEASRRDPRIVPTFPEDFPEDDTE